MENDMIRKLPDAEFEVMDAVWSVAAPVTTPVLMDKIGKSRGWKAPTLISFLSRLEERGFVRSEKKGKERQYFPLLEKEVYIRVTTLEFLAKYHGGSAVQMIDAIYGRGKMPVTEMEQMIDWLKDNL